MGCNSAEALLQALVFWQNNHGGFNLLNKHPCSAAQRNCGRISRIFYLQVLTTPDIMEQINAHLDRLRRAYALKSLLDSQAVGRAEFLLEALIFIIECFKEYGSSNSSLHIIRYVQLSTIKLFQGVDFSREILPDLLSEHFVKISIGCVSTKMKLKRRMIIKQL